MTGRSGSTRTSPQSAACPPLPAGEITLLLASRSPRRLQLLTEHGYRVRVVESGLDDGLLRCGRVEPAQWVAALAYLKAEAGLRAVRQDHRPAEATQDDFAADPNARGVVLGADTAVLVDDRIVGQPSDADDARRILHSLRERTHAVVTGVALIDVAGQRRTFFHESARVEVGRIDDEAIERYIAGEGWRGKAGAYNLRERLEAGWPIRYEGDPTTVMGLPMRRLGSALERFCQT